MPGRRDFSGFLCCACLTAVLLMLSSTQESSAKQEINCRKYVFAPVCRGVAAKRSFSLAPSYLYPSSNMLHVPSFREFLLGRRKLTF